MGMPKKGSRLFVFQGMKLRWRVRFDRSHWARGYGTHIRIVVEAADHAGQRLVVDFTASRRLPADDPLSNPFTPGFVRQIVAAGLAHGWRPDYQKLPPLHMGQAEVTAATQKNAHAGEGAKHES
jgi:hypothetical protein